MDVDTIISPHMVTKWWILDHPKVPMGIPHMADTHHSLFPLSMTPEISKAWLNAQILSNRFQREYLQSVKPSSHQNPSLRTHKPSFQYIWRKKGQSADDTQAVHDAICPIYMAGWWPKRNSRSNPIVKHSENTINDPPIQRMATNV